MIQELCLKTLKSGRPSPEDLHAGSDDGHNEGSNRFTPKYKYAAIWFVLFEVNMFSLFKTSIL